MRQMNELFRISIHLHVKIMAKILLWCVSFYHASNSLMANDSSSFLACLSIIYDSKSFQLQTEQIFFHQVWSFTRHYWLINRFVKSPIQYWPSVEKNPNYLNEVGRLDALYQYCRIVIGLETAANCDYVT